MLDTYFFVPGDKEAFLNKIDNIKVDYVVVDLEDAVSNERKIIAMEMVLNLKPQENYFVRIPFFENCYSNENLITIIKHFNYNVVLPKINNIEEIDKIIKLVGLTNLNMIVLVENPRGMFNITGILEKFAAHIHGIGFGSHDFCSVTGIKHTLANLEFYKRKLIFLAKVFEVSFIDGVDLDLINFNNFEEECKFAFDNGADGKFLIHPSQLNKLKEVSYLTETELKNLSEVYNMIKDIPEDKIDVLKIGGKIYEKPHIFRIKKLIDKINKQK